MGRNVLINKLLIMSAYTADATDSWVLSSYINVKLCRKVYCPLPKRIAIT